MYDQPASVNASFGIFPVIVFLAIYIYMAYCLVVLSKKTHTDKEWMSWIPILNLFQMIRIAGKPLWWFILFLIPIVNIIFAVIVWMKISERVGKDSWLGILMIIPIANLILPGYLAFSSSSSAPAPMQNPPAMPSM